MCQYDTIKKAVSVLNEILEWSQDRPVWQRNALRRLVCSGELTKNDISELLEICKSEHGLCEQQNSLPLAKDDIPGDNASSSPVFLASIIHVHGVNALEKNQALEFASCRSLTVIYGDNATGKTGYTRILKSMCRTRGHESILGNVHSNNMQHTPAKSGEYIVKFKVGEESVVQECTGEEKNDDISRVSVFDARSAAVYLTEETDIAFRPFGLDLFDKLAKACKAVQLGLEEELRELKLSASDWSSVQELVPEGTAVAKLLDGISFETKPKEVQTLAHLSTDEETRLVSLKKSLQDLQANDPGKLIQQKEFSVRRVRTLVQHLKKIEAELSKDAVSSVFTARDDMRQKIKEAKKLREDSFSEKILKGTGSEHWSKLWESARKFSEEEAYSGQEFPVVKDDAHCLLCQQGINREAGQRLKQFQAFAVSATEQELREIRGKFANLRKKFVDLQITDEASKEGIKEIRVEHESIAEDVSTTLVANERRRDIVCESLTNKTELPDDCQKLVFVADEVEDLAQQIDESIKVLRNGAKEENKKRMTEEVQELQAKKILSSHLPAVLGEIEREKKVAAYQSCLDDTKTQAITKKSATVTTKAVTKTLQENFQRELKDLAFNHVKMELTARGVKGVLYQKLVLTCDHSVKLPSIVSEGEHRCLAIAAFFAELSLEDAFSGIVFDDPVSSLDYKWREKVARRLVTEARKRQVIVFTHDIIFLHFLMELSEESNVKQKYQYMQKSQISVGVCSEGLPWVAQRVQERIGTLKKKFQAAEKLYKNGKQSAYEMKGAYIYGKLREAWERALEEILIDRVVERFRPSIKTQQVMQLAYIEEKECKILESAMTKCSKWLPGHDQARATREEFPKPEVLKIDIEELEKWKKSIAERRNAKKCKERLEGRGEQT